MRRIYLIILATMVSPVLMKAQQTETGHSQAAQQTQAGEIFTLEQCIQYALENSGNVKNARLDEDIANARVKETRGIGLPQVDGSVTVQHNQKLQRFFNSAGVVGAFTGQKIEGVDSTDIVAAQSPFQLKSAGIASVKINQILFNGSYIVGLRAANAYKDLSAKTTEQTKEQTIVQVTKAYYTALINSERMKLFDTNVGRVDSLLRTTTALRDNGFAEGIDVDRIRVTLNNLKTERENFRNLQILSLELLKFQMNYPMESELALAGTLDEIVIPESSEAYKADWDFTTRPDYQVLMANRKLQMLNIKNNYAAGLPSLVAFADVGYSTQSADIAGIFRTETNRNAAFPAGVGPDKWYSYSSFGVSLNVPLFSGLQRTYRIQQQKLALQKIENGAITLRSSIDLETKSSGTVFDNSLKTLVSQKENMDLAANVARVTKIKYEQGVGSNIEVIDAESSLKQAQINYYNALYDALIAKVDLDKAYGKLNPSTPQENK